VTLDELIAAGRNFATAAEAKAILEVDERTIYAGIERGEIPATRMGNRWKIPVAWLRKEAGLDGAPTAAPAIPDRIADAVADRVVAKLAAALAGLTGAATRESP
jgi:excisionase family DNA binding protein